MSRETVADIVTALRNLSNAVGAAFLYATDHPQVTSLIPCTIDALRQFVGREGSQTLVFVNGVALFHGKPLEADPHIMRLAKIFSQQGIGYVRFLSGVTPVDLRILLRVLTGVADKEILRNASLTIRIGDVEAPPEFESEAREIRAFTDLDLADLVKLGDLYQAMQNQQGFNLRDLANVVAGFVVAFRREANPLLALVPLRMLDEYTFTHSINVGILNVAQAMSLGIEGQLLHDIGIAGMLHDAGKIFVNTEITRKSGVLTTEEWKIMQQHPVRGAQYLLNQPGIPRLAVIAAFEHHMRADLRGYPRVPAGWQLNLCTHLTMISDTFDALRTKRVYKNAWDFPKSAGHMLSLTHGSLDPDLTLNFLKLLSQMGERAGVLAEGGTGEGA